MEHNQHSGDQEIDLSHLSRKIGNFFERIGNGFFGWIAFLKRNIIWVVALFIIGAGLGLYLDKTGKKYEQGLILQPNFGSTDYLYDKIELINAKVKEGDTLFLKTTVGLKHPKKFGKIEIKPIPDIYRFIDNNQDNFELIKLMAEDGDIDKIIEGNVTSKNYTTHALTFSTAGKVTKADVIDPLMKYLNDSEYYEKVREVAEDNIRVKIVENDSIIAQINGFLNAVRKKAGSAQNNSLVYYNENTQLNDVIKTKDQLIYEQGERRIQLLASDKVVKKLSETLNIRDFSGTASKMKFILPLLFIFLFMAFSSSIKYYKRKSSSATR